MQFNEIVEEVMQSLEVIKSNPNREAILFTFPDVLDKVIWIVKFTRKAISHLSEYDSFSVKINQVLHDLILNTIETQKIAILELIKEDLHPGLSLSFKYYKKLLNLSSIGYSDKEELLKRVTEEFLTKQTLKTETMVILFKEMINPANKVFVISELIKSNQLENLKTIITLTDEFLDTPHDNYSAKKLSNIFYLAHLYNRDALDILIRRIFHEIKYTSTRFNRLAKIDFLILAIFEIFSVAEPEAIKGIISLSIFMLGLLGRFCTEEEICLHKNNNLRFFRNIENIPKNWQQILMDQVRMTERMITTIEEKKSNVNKI